VRHITLAITGASGAVYGLRLTEELLRAGSQVNLLISAAGFTVLAAENGLEWVGTADQVDRNLQEYFAPAISMGLDTTAGEPSLHYYAENNFFAPIASGSSAPDAMVICPCSLGTVGRIAAGLSNTLIERAADVMLKEGRPLLLVPREMPLSALHLENLLKLARLGVRIVPPMPAFYHQPQTMADLVDFVVGKVLDQLGIEHGLFQRWGER
jgi:flavin prenyltransferase